MTQEEKVKAYDEALERARKQRADYQKELDKTDKNSQLAGLLRAGISAIELAFPELTESEDERIRKSLLAYIKGESKRLDTQKWISYLEKQKESLGDISTILLIKKWIDERKELWNKSRKEAIALDCSTLADDAVVRIEELNSIISFLDTIQCNSTEKQKEPVYTKRNALFDKCVENCDPEIMKKVSDEIDAQLQKEQKPAEQMVKPHNPDGSNPYDMPFEQAQTYINKRGLDLPWNDDDIYIDCFHLTQTLGNVLRWADEHPIEPKLWWNLENNPYTTKWTKEMIDEKFKELVEEYHEQKPVTLKIESNKWYVCIKDFYAGGKKHCSKGDLVQAKSGMYMMGLDEENAAKYFFPVNYEPKPAEWSKEDENKRQRIIKVMEAANSDWVLQKAYGPYGDLINWLKSLRPQPYKEIYQAAKHDLAIKFMNYLDENRPEGKMSLSNGECEDIDKAFKENDWEKVMRYANKYGGKIDLDSEIKKYTESLYNETFGKGQGTLDEFDWDDIATVIEDTAKHFYNSRPSWKPSEEQMKALLNAEGFLRAGLQHESAKSIAELYEQLKKLI